MIITFFYIFICNKCYKYVDLYIFLLYIINGGLNYLIIMNIKMKEIINKIYSYEQYYDKDTIVKSTQDICEYIGYLVEGSLKIIDYCIDGKEKIIKCIDANSFFGNNLIYSNMSTYPGYIIASSYLHIQFIKKEIFENELKKNKEFMIKYLNYISKEIIYMQNMLKIYSHTSSKEKLMSFFKYRCKLNNSNFFNYQSHSELAQSLNMPRPSFSRSLYALEKENLIKCVKKRIYILF